MLDRDTIRGRVAVVDAANVAIDDATREASVRRLLLLRDALNGLGCRDVIFIADASLRHRFTAQERETYEEMLRFGRFFQAPARTRADEYVIDLAKRLDGLVVANEVYERTERYARRWNLLAERRLPFLIVDDHVLIPIDGDEEPEAAGETVQAGAPDRDKSQVPAPTAAGALAEPAEVKVRSSSWLDVALIVPLLALCGGAVIGAIWLACLTVVALLLELEGGLGIGLGAGAAAVLLPAAVALMWWIGSLFRREEFLRATNIKASHMTGYAAVLTVMWGGALAIVLFSPPLWLGVAALVCAVGVPLPLMGFVRTIRKFRPFIGFVDGVVTAATFGVALMWLFSSSGAALWVVAGFVTDLSVSDRVIFGGLLPLIAVQAVLVVGEWIVPEGAAVTAPATS